jgi:hypothetical protein
MLGGGVAMPDDEDEEEGKPYEDSAQKAEKLQKKAFKYLEKLMEAQEKGPFDGVMMPCPTKEQIEAHEAHEVNSRRYEIKRTMIDLLCAKDAMTVVQAFRMATEIDTIIDREIPKHPKDDGRTING